MGESVKEGLATITFPKANDVFYNPVQQFNRDMSILAIKTWISSAQKIRTKKKRKLTDESLEASSQETTIILEALSATGLRAIRYAKELPDSKVTANDSSAAAVMLIRQNIQQNEVDQLVDAVKGDANSIMHSKKNFYDVIDLDPYGTAAPFIDAAVQCIKSGGLLCVTCTDSAVFAGAGYPEKTYANYGGLPIKGEFCHEAGIRLVLHSIASAAAKYGRSIAPKLCLSIDFYVRLFVVITTSPTEVKALARLDLQFSADIVKLAGPMYGSAIHDKNFANSAHDQLELLDEVLYKTKPRMKGMLSIVCEEIDSPFYFTPSALSGVLHCKVPPLMDFMAAINNGGYAAVNSHALRGSIKTDAPFTFLWDIMRAWIQKYPVKQERMKEGTAVYKILAQPLPSAKICFERSDITTPNKPKFPRYMENPEPFWGPKSRAAGKARHMKHFVKDDSKTNVKCDV